MTEHVFVPVCDDLIYDHPEKIEGPLVPYLAGMECSQWLEVEINPDEKEHDISVVQGKIIRQSKPKSHPKNKPLKSKKVFHSAFGR